MKRGQMLGELLVGDRVITAAERDRALENQAIYGGRLGTNLVDLNLIELEQVGQYLSVQLGVPVALGEDLLGAPQSVLPLLSREQCAHYMAFPLRLEGDLLHLALLDPLNRVACRELELLTRTRVKPYVAPELLLLQALEKRHGIQREKRFLRTPAPAEQEISGRRKAISLLMSPIEAQDEVLDLAPAAVPGRELELELDLDEPGSVPSLDRLSQLQHRDAEQGLPYHELGQPLEPGEDDEEYIDGDTTRQWERPPVQLLDAAASRRALERARDRDALLNHLTHAVDPRAAAATLFMVRGPLAVAHLSSSGGVSRERLEQLVVPLTTASLLQQAHNARATVRATATSDPMQQLVARHLGWPDPGEVCVAPVTVDDRVVHLLCVQTAAGNRFESGFCAALGRLCECAAQSYRRLVRTHKKQTSEQPRLRLEQPAATQAPPAERPTLYDTRFFITGEAGTRSFARVWRAVDTSTQKVVAVYVLPADLGSEATRRVTQHALALQKLSHPALTKIHGTGITAENMTYVVCEWIEGVDLRSRLQADPVPPRTDVARLIERVAGALELAHQSGLVHGDVNPENVLLLAPDRRRVKLVNFGITDLPPAERYLGAPEYRAPEVSAGAPRGPAADAYSLGVLAYEMLAGRLPDGPLDPRRPPIDLASAPSRAQRLIARALAVDPAARPTAGQLGRELKLALQGPPLPRPA